MTNGIHFSIETIQGMDFCIKIQFGCLTKFLNIQLSFLHGSKKNRLSLNFCFASFDSFKALTGCLEKLERLAN